ncbi:Uncharacterized protein HZ326_26186 [Fusarium oxysporum f. sp. albedinis]|nr:Uncharacterized protein HZ326_26186 [Fusarium oxysporum f. sp. albedinis]
MIHRAANTAIHRCYYTSRKRGCHPTTETQGRVRSGGFAMLHQVPLLPLEARRSGSSVPAESFKHFSVLARFYNLILSACAFPSIAGYWFQWKPLSNTPLTAGLTGCNHNSPSQGSSLTSRQTGAHTRQVLVVTELLDLPTVRGEYRSEFNGKHIKYGDTLTGGGEGVIKSEGCISMLWRIV